MTRKTCLPFAVALGMTLSLAASTSVPAQTPTPPLPPYLANFNAAQNWSFAPTLTSQLPGDAFTPAIGPLVQQQQFQLIQRLFDLWSWQAFLAMNWPTDSSGAPASSITGYSATYAPLWSAWHDAGEIYLPNGAKPVPCGQPTAALQASRGRNLAAFARRNVAAPPAAAAESRTATRVLLNVSAVGELLHGRAPAAPSKTKINEIDQAFSGPLFDQNGNPTFYEILMDNNEVGYLCANTLYNLNGQIAFSSNSANKVQFPSGTWQQNGSGAFELKLAWRILTTSDNAARFFNMPAYVFLNNQWVQRTIGLVGLHIAHKTQNAPQWIWSTFEQVDNLSVDAVANPTGNPSYFNPNCPTCLVNIPPSGNPPVNTPVQVLRMIPIPLDKQTLNSQAQAALRAQNSVWQYYQLIDTQWPTNPSAPPTPPGDNNLPQSINNKPGGNPTPVYLTNATMETYFQAGNQNAGNMEEGGPTSSQQAFGTESCMGCHSSAGIATSGTNLNNVNFSGQLTADFSWLMQMKAKFATSP
ncbi:MAG: hypothetical protein WDO17_21895 [Alphaproteobacteria bacterium]